MKYISNLSAMIVLVCLMTMNGGKADNACWGSCNDDEIKCSNLCTQQYDKDHNLFNYNDCMAWTGHHQDVCFAICNNTTAPAAPQINVCADVCASPVERKKNNCPPLDVKNP